MSLNKKITIISLLILLAIPVGSFWYFRRFQPNPPPWPPRPEIKITIIPGWNLRQIAADWIKKGIITAPEELYKVAGAPVYNYSSYKKQAPVLKFEDASGTPRFPLLNTKEANVSYEGYLFPDTYQVYADAKVEDVLKRIFDNLEEKITSETRAEIKRQNKTFFEVLIMASLLEEEVKDESDRAKVADILWRRLARGWALQVDSSVHYAVNRTGTVFTTSKERQVDSLYNTYKYPGLPLGPISNPGLLAIKAALYPSPNNYWYFLSDEEGKIHYARTLEEHNLNKAKYLR